MITYAAKAFCLALGASFFSAGLSFAAADNAQGSSSSAVVVKTHEVLVKVLNGVLVDVRGNDPEVDVKDRFHTNPGSRNSEDSSIVAPVKFGGLRAFAGNSCLGAGAGGDPLRPRPVRDGVRYRFNIQEDAECRDANNLGYEWGEFQDVTDTTECAEKCVNTAPESIVTGGTFRGFEFLCDTGQCRCLYDAGTLSTRSSRGYKRTKTSQGGVGPIAKSVPKSDRYCAKLVEAELLEIAIG